MIPKIVQWLSLDSGTAMARQGEVTSQDGPFVVVQTEGGEARVAEVRVTSVPTTTEASGGGAEQ